MPVRAIAMDLPQAAAVAACSLAIHDRNRGKASTLRIQKHTANAEGGLLDVQARHFQKNKPLAVVAAANCFKDR